MKRYVLFSLLGVLTTASLLAQGTPVAGGHVRAGSTTVSATASCKGFLCALFGAGWYAGGRGRTYGGQYGYGHNQPAIGDFVIQNNLRLPGGKPLLLRCMSAPGDSQQLYDLWVANRKDRRAAKYFRDGREKDALEASARAEFWRELATPPLIGPDGFCKIEIIVPWRGVVALSARAYDENGVYLGTFHPQEQYIQTYEERGFIWNLSWDQFKASEVPPEGVLPSWYTVPTTTDHSTPTPANGVRPLELRPDEIESGEDAPELPTPKGVVIRPNKN